MIPGVVNMLVGAALVACMAVTGIWPVTVTLMAAGLLGMPAWCAFNALAERRRAVRAERAQIASALDRPMGEWGHTPSPAERDRLARRIQRARNGGDLQLVSRAPVDERRERELRMWRERMRQAREQHAPKPDPVATAQRQWMNGEIELAELESVMDDVLGITPRDRSAT